MESEKKTNNEAEWLALIKGLDIARSKDIDDLVVFGDSMLVIKEAIDITSSRRKPTSTMHQHFYYLAKSFHSLTLLHILRHCNKRTDTMDNRGARLVYGHAQFNGHPKFNVWVP